MLGKEIGGGSGLLIRPILIVFWCIGALLIMPAYAKTADNYKLSESILGLELGKNTLEDVQAMLGKSRPISLGEGEPFKICYLSNPNKQLKNMMVVFEATSQITGLLAFSVELGSEIPPGLETCLKSSILSESAVTAGKLKLGMTRAQLEEIFGKASKAEGKKLSYIYKTKLKMSNEEMMSMKQQWPDEVLKDPYWNVTTNIQIGL
jgi:hypothetical protein